MTKLKNIIIYESWLDFMDDLTPEETGLLMKKIIHWNKGEDYETGDRFIEGYFKGMIGNLENAAENYQKTVERNRENGKKGGRPKTQETQVVISETHSNPENHKEKEKEKEKEREKEKETDKETEKENDTGKKIVYVDQYDDHNKIRLALDKGYKVMTGDMEWTYDDLIFV